jgi:hypothetical protein
MELYLDSGFVFTLYIGTLPSPLPSLFVLLKNCFKIIYKVVPVHVTNAYGEWKYSCTDLYGAETWTLRKVYLESFEMWCCRRMEISWTDRVRNEEVLHRVKEERNILHTINRRKADCIGHILHRKCLLTHVIEGKIKRRIEVMKRRGRKRKQSLDDIKGKRKH